MAFDVGDSLRFVCAFTLLRVQTDPTTVILTITSPTAVVYTLTLAGGDITRDSVGLFHYIMTMDEDGAWTWRWVGVGVITQAVQGRFIVNPV